MNKMSISKIKSKYKKDHLPKLVDGFTVNNKYSPYIDGTILDVNRAQKKVDVTWTLDMQQDDKLEERREYIHRNLSKRGYLNEQEEIKKEKESERELLKRLNRYPETINVQDMSFILSYEPSKEVQEPMIQKKDGLNLHILIPVSYILSGRNPTIRIQNIIEEMLDREKIEPKQMLIRMLLTKENLQYTELGSPHHFLMGPEDENEKVNHFIKGQVMEKVSNVLGNKITSLLTIREDPETMDNDLRHILNQDEPIPSLNHKLEDEEKIEVPITIRYTRTGAIQYKDSKVVASNIILFLLENGYLKKT